VAKGRKIDGKRTEKFFLGFNRIVAELQDAEKKIDKSIKVGAARVARAKAESVKKANRESLSGSREARRIVRIVVRQMSAAPCLDQFMNCDPEYYSDL
jgi:hypothetical protein